MAMSIIFRSGLRNMAPEPLEFSIGDLSLCINSTLCLEEGVVIENQSGTKKHTVSLSDKNIILKEGSLKTVASVLPKSEKTLTRAPGSNFCYIPQESFYKLILPDDYYFSKAPFLGYHRCFPSPRGGVINPKRKNETIALETLREYLSEVEFRRFIKYGFITVDAPSGKTYQVFQNNSHVSVFFKGVKVEEVCVLFKDRRIPSTDRVLAFKILIETDESEFRKLGNIYNFMKVALI